LTFFKTPRLFIQYQKNAPVPILIQSLPSVLQGEEAVVGDLVAARTADQTRRLLGYQKTVAHSLYTLLVMLWKQTNDLLIVLGHGTLGTNPLMMRGCC
jgi:hypothetical protein